MAPSTTPIYRAFSQSFGGFTILSSRHKEGVSKFWFILFFVLFFKTKPRLSQAGALSYHKNLVSLWYKTNYMAKLHFRDYNPKQIILFPQRLDKDIAENDPVRIVDTIVGKAQAG